MDIKALSCVVIFMFFLPTFVLAAVPGGADAGLIARISGEIARVAHADAAERLDMASVATFPWDHLLVFGPGADAKAIHDALGPAGDNFKTQHPTIANPVVLLVFLKDKAVVKAIEYPRVYGDFSMLGGHAAFEKAKAVFAVEADPRVPNWFVVKKPAELPQ